MLNIRKFTACSLATVVGALSFVPSAFAEGCDTYGKLALQQQKDNESGKCGLSGSEWSSDLKAHIAWCGSVSPQEWQATLKKRKEALDACQKK